MREPNAIHPGDLIAGRYRVVSEVADGGMGTVYLAEPRCAVKVLHRELRQDGELVHRFLREALAAGMLGHPHLVAATDAGFLPDRVPFIVFEYLDGVLLADEIRRAGRIPPRRAVIIARQIAWALENAHTAGIVHLDLKSDNVFLVERDGHRDHVKVFDFGIADWGTPECMAPEQIDEPEAIDERTDVYALGVLLHEMLSGRRPFTAATPRVLVHRILHEPPPPLRVPEVPASLAALVAHMLAKEPDDRPAGMAEVGDHLAAELCRLTFGTGSAPTLLLPPPPARAPAAVSWWRRLFS